MVVAVAVVGDLFSDSAAATVMSRLMLILGVAPIVAPSLGAAVLLHASWHWVFAVLIVLAGGLLALGALMLPETLPPAHRRPLRVRSIAATYVQLLADLRFVVLVLVAALAMSGLFAYISGASFVLQGSHGLDQQSFALVFAAGAIALIGAAAQRGAAAPVHPTAPRGVGAGGGDGGRGGVRRAGLQPRRRSARLPAAGVDDAGHARLRHPQRARRRPVAPPRGRRYRRGPAGGRPARFGCRDRPGRGAARQQRDRTVGGDDGRRRDRAGGVAGFGVPGRGRGDGVVPA
jgi:hypothetical protein